MIECLKYIHNTQYLQQIFLDSSDIAAKLSGDFTHVKTINSEVKNPC